MKKYLKYYSISRLTVPSKKGFFYAFVFALLNIVVYNKFISLTDMFTTGFTVMFMWSIFGVIYIVFRIQSDPTHPIYQFPFDYKDRIMNAYITIFVVFGFIVIGMILFASTTLLLFTIFSDIQNDIVNDPFYLAGTIY